MFYLARGLIVLVLLLFLLPSISYQFFNVYACHNPGKPLPSGQLPHPFNQPPTPTSGPCPAGLTELEELFKNVISVIVGLGFVGTFVLLVWAGIKYLTSGGEPKAIQTAHQTVTWALLGVVFMAIAWIVLQLLKVFTGVDVTVFDLKVLKP